MSWQKRSIQLILGLPFSLPIVTYAVNIGDTYVQSQQNQPLKARINVSDIDPATFSVKLADGSAYQQLGLSKEATVNVKFEPTSSNGGQIVITSSKPLTTPFADVVLNVTDKGETKTLPKTLLLPIDDSKQIVTQSNTELVELKPKTVTLGSNNPVNLPIIDELTPVNVSEPVAVQTAPTTIATNPVTIPITSATTTSGESLKGSLDRSKNLIIQETRHIATPNGTTVIPKPTTTQSDNPLDTTHAKPATTKPAVTTEATTNDVDSQETVTYVIQRNDNLWTIANDLAKKNKTNVNQVMKDIITANPNAFENGNPNKLVENAELQVPKYQVMPSQVGIKTANALKKQTQVTVSKKPTVKTTPKPSTSVKAVKKPVQVVKKTPKTVSRPVARPIARPPVKTRTEMKIIAPSTTNGSNQGSNRADKAVGKNSQTSQIVTQVQQKRQITASQASKVGQLNQNLVSAEKRLKLQNQKLAQLEERLKELNKK